MIRRLQVGSLAWFHVKHWDDKKIVSWFEVVWLYHCCFCSVGIQNLRDKLELELEELGSIREMQVKESEASGKISGLEKKIQYADIEKVTSMINLCIIFSFTWTWHFTPSQIFF